MLYILFFILFNTAILSIPFYSRRVRSYILSDDKDYKEHLNWCLGFYIVSMIIVFLISLFPANTPRGHEAKIVLSISFYICALLPVIFTLIECSFEILIRKYLSKLRGEK